MKNNRARNKHADDEESPGKTGRGNAGLGAGGRARGRGPCDFCSRISTPVWRRGPSWAPTLCNACGAHYLTKKTLVGYVPKDVGQVVRRKKADKKPQNSDPTAAPTSGVGGPQSSAQVGCVGEGGLGRGQRARVPSQRAANLDLLTASHQHQHQHLQQHQQQGVVSGWGGGHTSGGRLEDDEDEDYLEDEVMGDENENEDDDENFLGKRKRRLRNTEKASSSSRASEQREVPLRKAPRSATVRSPNSSLISEEGRSLRAMRANNRGQEQYRARRLHVGSDSGPEDLSPPTRTQEEMEHEVKAVQEVATPCVTSRRRKGRPMAAPVSANSPSPKETRGPLDRQRDLKRESSLQRRMAPTGTPPAHPPQAPPHGASSSPVVSPATAPVPPLPKSNRDHKPREVVAQQNHLVLQMYPYSKKEALNSAESPLNHVELKDILTFESFTSLPPANQRELVKYLNPNLDMLPTDPAAGISEETSAGEDTVDEKLFHSPQFQDQILAFQKLLKAGMFEPSSSNKRVIFEHFQTLLHDRDLRASGWREKLHLVAAQPSTSRSSRGKLAESSSVEWKERHFESVWGEKSERDVKPADLVESCTSSSHHASDGGGSGGLVASLKGDEAGKPPDDFVTEDGQVLNQNSKPLQHSIAVGPENNLASLAFEPPEEVKEKTCQLADNPDDQFGISTVFTLDAHETIRVDFRPRPVVSNEDNLVKDEPSSVKSSWMEDAPGAILGTTTKTNTSKRGFSIEEADDSADPMLSKARELIPESTEIAQFTSSVSESTPLKSSEQLSREVTGVKTEFCSGQLLTPEPAPPSSLDKGCEVGRSSAVRASTGNTVDVHEGTVRVASSLEGQGCGHAQLRQQDPMSVMLVPPADASSDRSMTEVIEEQQHPTVLGFGKAAAQASEPVA